MKHFAIVVLLVLTSCACEEVEISPFCDDISVQCFTVTSFANIFQDHLNSTLKLTFLPGNHNLETDLTIMDVNQLTIQSSNNSSIDTYLACKRNKIILSEMHSVAIRGINLDCNNIILKKTRQVFFEDLMLLSDDSPVKCIPVIGTALYIYNSTISVPICAESSTVTVNNASFCHIPSSDPAIRATGCTILLTSASFKHNYGGALVGRNSSITVHDNILIFNHSFSALYIETCTLSVEGNVTITDNHAEFGGGVSAYESSIEFKGSTEILRNTAKEGGAIHIVKSSITFRGHLLISQNLAQETGGGISAYVSDINFYDDIVLENNQAEGNGGGLYMSNTVISFQQPGNNSIQLNSALNGGGAYFTSYSKLLLVKQQRDKIDDGDPDFIPDFAVNLRITDNTATNRGGAIFVNDETYFAACQQSDAIYNQDCFIQIEQLYTFGKTEFGRTRYRNIFFSGNSAGLSGNLLHGGLLDRCLPPLFAEFNELADDNRTNGISYLAVISDAFSQEASNDTSLSIASKPLSVYLCGSDSEYYSEGSYSLYYGQTLNLSVIVFDQVNNSMKANLFSFIRSGEGRLNEGQAIQPIGIGCTSLSYNIFSPFENDSLTLYADGPCRDTEPSIAVLHVTFRSCPQGFEHDSDGSLSCNCHSSLQQYAQISCDINTRSIERRNELWVSYTNATNTSGLIIHPHCPYDYCHPPTTPVHINLESQEGSNSQCAFNRSGTLCGACRDGYSLVLGSSKCTKCTNVTIAIILPIAVAGVLLVAIILLLRLTVDVGTINGLILYTNIITAIGPAYIPFETPNYATAIIAWLNLELGFETCFYNGMDMYARTWLELAFPAYIICLVAAIIIASERSNRFVKVLGSANPVAVLATLILLSFARLFQITVTILSFTVLTYPDGHTEAVWLADPNVRYLRGKHIPLFLAATGIVILGFLYISLLTFHRILVMCNCCVLTKWLDNTRLKSFVDAYFAPFEQGYQSWSGILLLIRAVVFFTSAFNISGDQLINLTAVAIVTFFTITVRQVCKKMYKVHTIGILETFFLMNLGVYTLGSAYIRQNGGNQVVLAYLSMNFTLVMFIFMLLYHILVVKQKLTFFTSKLNRKRSSLAPSVDKERSLSTISSTVHSNFIESSKMTLTSSEQEQKSANFTALREELLD